MPRVPNIIRNLGKAIGKNRWPIGVAGLLLIFAVMNGLLIRQNLQLRKALTRFEPVKLKSGDVLEPFTAGELHGSTIDIDYNHNSPRRVLLFFSPGCSYSGAQFFSWRAIIRQAPVKGFQVHTTLGINISPK
ncbi:MAG: hypothetical protein ND895_13600 [Pyrinomonadaceae bacterium]|nr:hypothetical protein [Pyrinomonadaceae bacterium]